MIAPSDSMAALCCNRVIMINGCFEFFSLSVDFRIPSCACVFADEELFDAPPTGIDVDEDALVTVT